MLFSAQNALTKSFSLSEAFSESSLQFCFTCNIIRIKRYDKLHDIYIYTYINVDLSYVNSYIFELSNAHVYTTASVTYVPTFLASWI